MSLAQQPAAQKQTALQGDGLCKEKYKDEVSSLDKATSLIGELQVMLSLLLPLLPLSGASAAIASIVCCSTEATI